MAVANALRLDGSPAGAGERDVPGTDDRGNQLGPAGRTPSMDEAADPGQSDDADRSSEEEDGPADDAAAAEPTDPVQAAFLGQADLYDVATWEVRSVVDALSVALYGGLRQARSSAIVALAAVLFLGLFGLAVPIVADQPYLGLLALLSIAPALVLMGYLWIGDPTQREPLEPLAVTFLLSVLFATFAAVVNTLLRAPFDALGPLGLAVFFFVVVGPIEESVKWLAVRLHAFDQPTFGTVVDGVVYGAVAGLGFAAIENLNYILDAYLTAQQAGTAVQFWSATQTAVGRFFVGPGHVLFSALAGYYLGLAKFNPARRGPIVVKGLLLAALAHAFYNTVVSYVPFTQVTFVAFVVAFDGVLLLVLLRKVSRYESFYHRIGRRPTGEGVTADRENPDGDGQTDPVDPD